MGKFPERNDLCAADLRERQRKNNRRKRRRRNAKRKGQARTPRLAWRDYARPPLRRHRVPRQRQSEMGHMHGDELAVSSSILGDRSHFDLTNKLIRNVKHSSKKMGFLF